MAKKPAKKSRGKATRRASGKQSGDGPSFLGQGDSIDPMELAEQMKLVRGWLSAVGGTVTAAELARVFDGAKPARLGEILDTLVALGHARKGKQGYAGV